MALSCVLLGWLAVCVAASGAARAVPLYTNEDLDRVHPLRGQTGVLCVPAVTPSAETPAVKRGARRARVEEGADEAFWRREAARHRRQMARLERAAAGLSRKIEQQRRRRPTGRSNNASLETLEARLAEAQVEIEQAESEFAERGRLAGALPGWLR